MNDTRFVSYLIITLVVVIITIVIIIGTVVHAIVTVVAFFVIVICDEIVVALEVAIRDRRKTDWTVDTLRWSTGINTLVHGRSFTALLYQRPIRTGKSCLAVNHTVFILPKYT